MDYFDKVIIYAFLFQSKIFLGLAIYRMGVYNLCRDVKEMIYMVKKTNAVALRQKSVVKKNIKI